MFNFRDFAKSKVNKPKKRKEGSESEEESMDDDGTLMNTSIIIVGENSKHFFLFSLRVQLRRHGFF